MRLLISLILLLPALLTVHAAPAQGASLADTYNGLEHLPSDTLLERGMRWAEFDSRPDSALVAFTIVAGRYRPDMDKESKLRIIGAYNGLWFTYFFHYFDYAKSNENLRRALDLYDEGGYPKGRGWLNYGCMYQTIGESAGDADLLQEAIKYYTLAFDTFEQSGNYDGMVTVFTNVITVAHTLGDVTSVTPLLDRLKTYEEHFHKSTKSDRWRYDYSRAFYRALQLLESGRAKEAASAFNEADRHIPPRNGDGMRYNILLGIYRGKAYGKAGNHAAALADLRRAVEISDSMDIKDSRLFAYQAMAEGLEKAGDPNGALEFRNRYLSLKDTLLNYRQLASVKEMAFLDQMRQSDRELADMHRRQQVMAIVISASLLVALVIAVFLVLVHRKNKRLHATNQALYDKNQRLMAAEEKAALNTAVLPDPGKYKTSTLDDTAKSALLQQVQQFAAQSEEIYRNDFSAERMAELLGVPYRQISQVVNEQGTNIATFLNEYRVRRACRLMDSSQSDTLTIEGVAHAVGFKSRNAFAAAFRRFTGMKPSDYMNIARQRRAETC